MRERGSERERERQSERDKIQRKGTETQRKMKLGEGKREREREVGRGRETRPKESGQRPRDRQREGALESRGGGSGAHAMRAGKHPHPPLHQDLSTFLFSSQAPPHSLRHTKQVLQPPRAWGHSHLRSLLYTLTCCLSPIRGMPWHPLFWGGDPQLLHILSGVQTPSKAPKLLTGSRALPSPQDPSPTGNQQRREPQALTDK